MAVAGSTGRGDRRNPDAGGPRRLRFARGTRFAGSCRRETRRRRPAAEAACLRARSEASLPRGARHRNQGNCCELRQCLRR